MEIKRSDDVVYKDMQELGDELPSHSPRFVLLSYPLTMVRRRFQSSKTESGGGLVVKEIIDSLQASGRLSVPYVMLYYLPVTSNNELKMLYAGAKELMRNTAEVNRIIEIDSSEDVEEIEQQLKGEE